MSIKQDNFEYPDSLDPITRELFAEAEENLHKKIARYSESVKRCISLNDMNIREKALVASTIHHGFINSLYAEKRKLKLYEKALKVKTQEYISKNGLEDIPRYKSDEIIQGEKEIRVLKDNIELQKEIISYLEDVCKVMATFGYNVKNSVELMKLM